MGEKSSQFTAICIQYFHKFHELARLVANGNAEPGVLPGLFDPNRDMGSFVKVEAFTIWNTLFKSGWGVIPNSSRKLRAFTFLHFLPFVEQNSF